MNVVSSNPLQYVTTAQGMVAGTDMEHDDVVTVLRKAHGSNQGLFNNAAQAWNHSFYWNCMKPNGGGKPSGKLADLIDKSFGSYDEFKAQFLNAGSQDISKVTSFNEL